MGNFYKGLYKVTNIEKYIGDPAKCIYRSSWERTLMIKLDHNPNVLRFGSEPFPIKYLSRYDNQVHNYWPDFIVVFKTGKQESATVVIEVKPKKETLPPEKRGKKKYRYLQESKTYVVNMSKWAAAKQFCKKQGWHFSIMTEEEIFGKLK